MRSWVLLDHAQVTKRGVNHGGRQTLDLKPEVEERFHRTKNVRWRIVSPLRDGQNSRLSGRNDKFRVVDYVGESNFSEVGFSSNDQLKQKKMPLPVIGQLRISGQMQKRVPLDKSERHPQHFGAR